MSWPDVNFNSCFCAVLQTRGRSEFSWSHTCWLLQGPRVNLYLLIFVYALENKVLVLWRVELSVEIDGFSPGNENKSVQQELTRFGLLYAQTHLDYFAHKNEQINQILHVKLAESWPSLCTPAATVRLSEMSLCWLWCPVSSSRWIVEI